MAENLETGREAVTPQPAVESPRADLLAVPVAAAVAVVDAEERPFRLAAAGAPLAAVGREHLLPESIGRPLGVPALPFRAAGTEGPARGGLGLPTAAAEPPPPVAVVSLAVVDA